MSTSLAYRGWSRDREPSIPVRGLIVLVAPSSALSYSKASEGVGLCAAVRVGCWRLALVAITPQSRGCEMLLRRIYVGQKYPHIYTLSISISKNQSTEAQ